MTSFPHNNSRRDKVEAEQREAARRRNEAGANTLRRLFPSLNGPAFQRVQPPTKES